MFTVRIHAQQVIGMGIRTGDDVGRGVEEPHRTDQVAPEQQVAIAGDRHITHVTEGRTAAAPEPDFIPRGVQLDQEGRVVHHIGVQGVEGDGIAELAADIDVIARTAYDVHRAIGELARALLQPEQIAVGSIAGHKDIDARLQGVGIRHAGQRLAVEYGCTPELPGDDHVPIWRNCDAVRTLHPCRTSTGTEPLQCTRGSIEPGDEDVQRPGGGCHGAVEEVDGAHELAGHDQTIAADGDRYASIDAHATGGYEPLDATLRIELGHEKVSTAIGAVRIPPTVITELNSPVTKSTLSSAIAISAT